MKKANPSPQKPKPAETQIPAIVDEASLLSDLRSLIQSARQRIVAVAYSTQTLLCWYVGRRLMNEHLQGGRAAYGKQILVTVSRELTTEYGRCFSYAEIARMIQFSQPSRVGTFLCPRGQRRLFPRGHKNRAHPTRLSDLRSLIQSARQRIATVANSTATLLFLNVGRRLLRENLQAGRAAYGKQILATVSQELTAEYGRGFSYAEIARMIQFSRLFPDEAIVVTLSRQLSWPHFHALLPFKDQP